MPNITSADDKYYYAGDKKIAKGGLSTAKRKEFDAMLPTQTMAPNPTTAYDPRFDAPGAQIENINSLEQLGINPNAVSSAAVAPALNVSNPAIVPPAAMAPVMNAMPATNVQPPLPPVQPMQPILGRQTVTTDVQQGFKQDPKLIKAQEDAYAARVKAIEKASIAEEKANQNIMAEQQNTEIQLAQIEQQRQQIEQRKQVAVSEVMDKYQGTIKELDDAKVDPDRFYGGSVGKRVLAAISIGLGEYARIMTGGSTNTALQIINKAIDDDMAAQRANITQLGNKASLQRQMMSDLRSKFDDEQSGNMAVKAAMLEQAQRRVAQISTGLKSEQAKANAMDMMAQLEQQKVGLLTQVQQAAANKVATRTVAEYAIPTPQSNKEQTQAATDLRKEYNAHPVTKLTYERKQHINNIESIAKQGTNMSHIALISSFVKMMDPGSTVNAGEVATVKNSPGLDDRTRNLYNAVIEGKKLTPAQVDEIRGVAGAVWKSQEKEQKLIQKQYTGIAQKQGIDLTDIFAPEDVSTKPANELSTTFQPRGK